MFVDSSLLQIIANQATPFGNSNNADPHNPNPNPNGEEIVEDINLMKRRAANYHRNNAVSVNAISGQYK